jgi:hypothetical protein
MSIRAMMSSKDTLCQRELPSSPILRSSFPLQFMSRTKFLIDSCCATAVFGVTTPTCSSQSDSSPSSTLVPTSTQMSNRSHLGSEGGKNQSNSCMGLTLIVSWYRVCPGRYIADRNAMVVIAKVLENYEILPLECEDLPTKLEWTDGILR